MGSTSQPAATSVKPAVDEICRLADRQGLQGSSLSTLLRLLTHQSTLDQRSQLTLIKSCYPAEKVPSSCVYMIVSALGPSKKKPSTTVQQALLKWLILVFDLLEEDAVLSRLYSTLFALLDVLYLRPRLCHLVAKITRRKHISSARCQFLKRLTDGITTEPNLYKLSAIFETLDPSSNGAPKSKLPIRFPHPDPHWIENLRPILRSHRPPAEWLPPSPDGFTFYGLPPSESNGAEIGRQPYGPLNLRNSDDLVSHLEGLQESDLESSALISSLSLHAVSLTKTGFHSRQMNATIANLLENQRQELEHVRRLSESLLDRLLAYTRSTKVSDVHIVSIVRGD